MKLNHVGVWTVDITNVLLQNLPEAVQKFHEREKTPPENIALFMKLIPHAIEGLSFLVRRVGAENVWLVGKSCKQQSAATFLAFQKHRICEATGFDLEHVALVPTKLEKIKTILLLDSQGHIDDRGEYLASVQQGVDCPIWFNPTSRDIDKWVSRMQLSVRVVSGWLQFMESYDIIK